LKSEQDAKLRLQAEMAIKQRELDAACEAAEVSREQDAMVRLQAEMASKQRELDAAWEAAEVSRSKADWYKRQRLEMYHSNVSA
jgi:hypothetical protein